MLEEHHWHEFINERERERERNRYRKKETSCKILTIRFQTELAYAVRWMM